VTDRLEDDQFVAAVERYLESCGNLEDYATLTDVLVVTVRRGFDHEGGKSLTNILTPTDSAVPILLGMSRYAQLRFEKMVNDSFNNESESGGD